MCNAIRKDQHVIKLLMMIKNISHGQDETKYSVMAFVESEIDLYTTKEGPLQTNTEFLRSFRSMVETIQANDSVP